MEATYYDLLTLYLFCEYSGERFSAYVPNKIAELIIYTFYEQKSF